MKPRTYSYPNDTFRGYVTTYNGNVMTAINCTEVRPNKLKALEDAKKLITSLRENDGKVQTVCDNGVLH